MQQVERGRLGKVWDATVARLLTGKRSHYPAAEWMHVDDQSEARFLQRAGCLFEDNEGAAAPCNHATVA